MQHSGAPKLPNSSILKQDVSDLTEINDDEINEEDEDDDEIIEDDINEAPDDEDDDIIYEETQEDDIEVNEDTKDPVDEFGNYIFEGTTEPDDDIGFSKKLNLNNFSDVDFYNNICIKPTLTSKYLSRFEKIRVISERITMLTNGAPSTLTNGAYDDGDDVTDKTNLEIANLELKHGRLPFIIQRKLPNGKIENVSVNALINIL